MTNKILLIIMFVVSLSCSKNDIRTPKKDQDYIEKNYNELILLINQLAQKADFNKSQHSIQNYIKINKLSDDIYKITYEIKYLSNHLCYEGVNYRSYLSQKTTKETSHGSEKNSRVIYYGEIKVTEQEIYPVVLYNKSFKKNGATLKFRILFSDKIFKTSRKKK